jgi:plasmid stabilization system protein ParE
LKRIPVRWTEPASLDLIEIVEFIHHDRPTAARKLGQAILLAASRLNRQPRRGKIVPELLEQGISDYRQILVTVYRVVYAIRAESIDIMAVIDSRRDLQEALFRRLIR